jgi:hypothetical protein
MTAQCVGNDPGGSRTRDLRIKSRAPGARTPNNLGPFPSRRRRHSVRIRPAIFDVSVTNPITSR